MEISGILTTDLYLNGFSVDEADDHFLILLRYGKQVAVFNAAAVRHEAIIRAAHDLLKEGVDKSAE